MTYYLIQFFIFFGGHHLERQKVLSTKYKKINLHRVALWTLKCFFALNYMTLRTSEKDYLLM